MNYIKNSTIAHKINVSNTTVANWIKSSIDGNNDLVLTDKGGRSVVIDSDHNWNILRMLKAKGRKHRIDGGKKVVIKAKRSINKIFNTKQLSQIFYGLTTRLEVPYKYTYLDKGADLWHENYKYSISDPKRSKNKESKLIAKSLHKITGSLRGYSKVNIIDVGCGNGLPAIPIIRHLINEGYELSYTGVDISSRMVEIDKEILLNEFPDLDFNEYVFDIDEGPMSDFFLSKKSDSETANLVLFLGGTLGNYDQPDRVIANLRDSIGQDDYLLLGNAITDNQSEIDSYKANYHHYHRTTWILDMLGLEKYYNKDSLNKYDARTRTETRKVMVSKDLSIEIDIAGSVRVITLNRFDEILVYSYKKFSELELVSKVISQDFCIEQLTTNRDRSYALLMVCTRQFNN